MSEVVTPDEYVRRSLAAMENPQPAVSLRDLMAMNALVGINANPIWDEHGWTDRAKAAYEAADAMLAVREI